MINVTSSNPEKEISSQNKLIKNLLEQLPSYSQFAQTFHISQTNWLPFYWNGFDQTTRYTYKFDELDLDHIWGEIKGTIRRHIKVAQEKNRISVIDDLPIDQFVQLDESTYKGKNLSPLYSKSI